MVKCSSLVLSKKNQKAQLALVAIADPKGNINILFDGHNFFVEESENLKN